MTEKIFPSGFYLNKVHDKAPAFVKANVSIHVEKALEWLEANKGLANEKGYITIVGMESEKKNDRGEFIRYFAVDTYKPKTDTSEGAPF